MPTHRNDEGLPTSSSSQPAIMAVMLAQLAARPGDRILEIGAGTGYNAALLSHLVGRDGHVVSVDLSRQVADEATSNLRAAGAGNVEAVAGDGGLGWPAGAPYDRLIVTCGPADIPPAWWEQLRPGGRMVVPLTLAPGVARSCAFDLEDGVLLARSLEPCGFMPLRGEYGVEPFERLAVVAEDIFVGLTPDPGVDGDTVRGWLYSRPRVHRLPVLRGDQDFWQADLRLTLWAGDPGTAVLNASGPAVDARRWPLIQRHGEGKGAWGTSFGCASAGGLALLGWTRPPSARLAVFGYGSDREPERRLIAIMDRWVSEGRSVGRGLSLRVYPAGVEPRVAPDERVVERRSCTLVLGFKAASQRP